MTMSREVEDSLQVCQTIQNELEQQNLSKKQVPGVESEYNTTELILEPAEKAAEFKTEPVTGLELEPAGMQESEPMMELELEPVAGLELEPAGMQESEPVTELELEPVAGLELEPADFPMEEPASESVGKTAKKEKKNAVKSKKQKPEKEKKNVSHPVLRTILSVLICLFTALVFALLITEFVAHHTSVTGSSMEMTLADGDEIIVENISYYMHEPKRFDIIVFSGKQGINYIKRIVGMPGETVQILDGYLYVNGQQLDESYGKEVMSEAGLAAQEIVLGPDEYFVLGDNRNGSIDSRKEEVGNVKKEQIKGKAWLRFYPFSHFGSVE